MRTKFITVLIVTLFALPTGAQTTEPLVHDSSRKDLFDLMLDYKGMLVKQEHSDGKTLYSLPATFKFPHDAMWKNAALAADARSNQIFGIDLSHHNVDQCKCLVDWKLLSEQQVKFAYLKASQGTRNVDPQYRSYRDGARSLAEDAKILIGAYHFLSADGRSEDQAANFLAAIGKKLMPDDLPPTLDLEWDIRVGKDGKMILGADGKPRDFWDTTTGNEILRRAVAWLAAVEKATGRKPSVYTNSVWWGQRIGDGSKIKALARYQVWIADYSKTGRAIEIPTVPGEARWKLWQFTSKAEFERGGVGTGHQVDANVFNGTRDQFMAAMGVRQ